MPSVYNMANKDYPNGAVYVGRSTPFGNPFKIGPGATRDDVIRKFKQHLKANPALVAKIKNELRGKDLICHCAPQACHADELLRIANAGGFHELKKDTKLDGIDLKKGDRVLAVSEIDADDDGEL